MLVVVPARLPSDNMWSWFLILNKKPEKAQSLPAAEQGVIHVDENTKARYSINDPQTRN